MATPKSILIVDDIVTAVAGIDGTGNYKTTVVLAERGIKTWDEISDARKPYVGVAPARTDYEHSPHTLLSSTMGVWIAAHVNGADKAERITNLYNLIDDIKAALYVDQTRGGNATTTLMIDAVTDAADPHDAGGGTLLMQIDVVYEEDLASS